MYAYAGMYINDQHRLLAVVIAVAHEVTLIYYYHY